MLTMVTIVIISTVLFPLALPSLKVGMTLVGHFLVKMLM